MLHSSLCYLQHVCIVDTIHGHVGDRLQRLLGTAVHALFHGPKIWETQITLLTI